MPENQEDDPDVEEDARGDEDEVLGFILTSMLHNSRYLINKF